MTDGGSHFKNALLARLTVMLDMKHHITLPRCPWSNGTIEQINDYIQRAFRTLCAAGTIKRVTDWPRALPLVERRINDIAVRSHDYPPRVTFLNQETGRTTAYNVLHLPDTICRTQT